MIETNFMSGVRLSRHYLPKMRAKNWGRIVFISSESAINIPVEMIHCGVTKTMQLALARGLAETTAGSNVTVNSILAGPTWSEGVEGFVSQMAKSRGVAPFVVEKEFFETVRRITLSSHSLVITRTSASSSAWVCRWMKITTAARCAIQRRWKATSLASTSPGS